MSNSKLSNKEIMTAVLNGQVINVTSYIDETYGEWSESYRPHKNGYIKVIKGASNWTYCPACGNVVNNNGQDCGCDTNNFDEYQFFSNSDLVSHLSKLTF